MTIPTIRDVFNAWFAVLPQREWCDDVVIKSDGEEILCKTQWLAELIADFIEQLTGETGSVRTGYYDPEEDAKEPNGPFDSTGWYYVDFD